MRWSDVIGPLWVFLSLAVKHGVQPRYALRAVLYVVKLGFFEPFRVLERIAMKARGEPKALPTPPVFILGYYRSGTTHLQEIMLQDPGLAYMDFYQGFFPTAFSSTDRFIRPLFEWIITSLRFRHPAHDIPFSHSLPCEEDVSMVAGAHSLAANWGQVFPEAFKEIYGKWGLMQGISEEDERDWACALHDLLWRVSKARGHKRLLLKSPPQTGRLDLLRRMYPGAKFVFIRRHPVQVYESNLKLWKSFEGQHMHQVSPEQVHEYILWSYEGAHGNYLRDRDAVEDGELCEVSFEDLIADPLAVIRDIYESLDLGDFDALEPTFQAYIDSHHQGEPRASCLGPELRAQVEERLAPWLQLWGYDAPAIPARRDQKAAATR